jgi:hypothetical protein
MTIPSPHAMYHFFLFPRKMWIWVSRFNIKVSPPCLSIVSYPLRCVLPQSIYNIFHSNMVFL